MGEKIQCPACGDKFHIHGYEIQKKCYECNTRFNPQRNKVNE